MNVDNLKLFNQTTLYEQVNSRFSLNDIKFNVHTSLDENKNVEDSNKNENSSNLSDVQKNDNKPWLNVLDIQVSKSGFVFENENDLNKKDYISEILLSSVTSFSDNKVLKNALENGSSVNESVNLNNGYNAYKKTENLDKYSNEILSNYSYKVL